jgi:hypothetical protein
VDAVAVVVLAKTTPLHLLKQSQAVQVLMQRPVVDHRARGVDHLLLGLEHGHRDTGASQAVGGDEPHRAGSHHDHAVV